MPIRHGVGDQAAEMFDEKGKNRLITDIVKLLQPSDLSQADLRREIAEEIEFVESARDHYDKFELDAYPPPPSKAEGRRQADEFIDAASRTLAAFDAFSREYKAPLLDYLIHSRQNYDCSKGHCESTRQAISVHGTNATPCR
jgi:hypothetical protein